MPKHTEGPATAAFLAGLTDQERGQRELVLTLADQERAALPSRLRRLASDEQTLVWNAAKAERDAAIEAATVARDTALEAAGDDTAAVELAVTAYAAAVAAAKDTWQAAKAELQGEG